jgi:HD-GYP domain-containing protein (c-di-GMP phosphodiesterase class II)
MNFITKSPARTGLVLLVLFFIMSVLLIMKYAEKERQRDLQNWQSRLGILADMRKASVEDWLNDRKTKLQKLSVNPTLQLYLSQYEDLNDDEGDVGRAQFSHVRNLLHAATKRFDFHGLSLGSINVGEEANKPGLAVLSKKGKLLFSTKGFLKDVSPQKTIIEDALKTGKEHFLGMFSTNDRQMRYGYVVPVFHIQRMQFQKPVGAVMVLLDPKFALFGKLQNLYLNTDSDETLLLRSAENTTVFISPLRGVFNVFHQMPKDNINLAANFAIKNVGDFSQAKDYRNKKVLLTARKINNTPWILMQKIDAEEALEESNRHQRFVLTTFILLSVFLIALFVAVWRHSTSVRLQKLSADLESRTVLLNAVTDNINEHIFLIDSEDCFVFSNLSLSNALSVKADDLLGKNMANVFGPDVAEKLQLLKNNQNNVAQEHAILLPRAKNESAYHVSSDMLQHGEFKNDRLFVLHDITSLKAAQDKRDQLAKGIISTLVKAVDLYDPHCVDHSERTREVAVDIAHELQLSGPQCETLEMSALLANIGKLFVPKEILTKMDALSEEESKTLRKHTDSAVGILKQLDFEGPVVGIIAQKNEKLDGSGYPKGLSGEDIMLESRILAVANAFVAMASSRAYRQGRPVKEVIDILLEQTDTHYDRHVVAALFHIAENKSDWKKWQVVNEEG